MAKELLGESAYQQQINCCVRELTNEGLIEKRVRPDGKSGLYPRDPVRPKVVEPPVAKTTVNVSLKEDDIKRLLRNWLESEGWLTKVA